MYWRLVIFYDYFGSSYYQSNLVIFTRIKMFIQLEVEKLLDIYYGMNLLQSLNKQTYNSDCYYTDNTLYYIFL